MAIISHDYKDLDMLETIIVKMMGHLCMEKLICIGEYTMIAKE